MSEARPLKELYPSCTHVVARYIGRLTVAEAAARLGIARSSFLHLFNGHFDDMSRFTVMSNNWMETLPQLYPQATDRDREELEAWYQAIVGDCPLALFIGHMEQKEAAKILGIKPNSLNKILFRGAVPFRSTVMANRWKEIVPQLHANLARGKLVPEEHIKKWNAWIDNIIGTCPLAPFIGHLQMKQAGHTLGIGQSFLRSILNGEAAPSRHIVMKYDWEKVLPTLHPCAVRGEPVPEEDTKRLKEWLESITGPHILYRFIGHLKYAETYTLLGVPRSYLDNILNGTTMASPHVIGVNDWRNKLLKANPDAAAQDIWKLDKWLLSCWNARSRTPPGLRKKWKKAVGEVFKTVRMHSAPDMDLFLAKWPGRTRKERQQKTIYIRMETGDYGKENMREEMEAYLSAACEVCRVAGITGPWVTKMRQGNPSENNRVLFETYRRLASLFPPLTHMGGQLPALAAC